MADVSCFFSQLLLLHSPIDRRILRHLVRRVSDIQQGGEKLSVLTPPPCTYRITRLHAFTTASALSTL